jgi:hypothetical protein
MQTQNNKTGEKRKAACTDFEFSKSFNKRTDECAVCIEVMNDPVGSCLMMLPCQHLFHQTCALQCVVQPNSGGPPSSLLRRSRKVKCPSCSAVCKVAVYEVKKAAKTTSPTPLGWPDPGTPCKVNYNGDFAGAIVESYTETTVMVKYTGMLVTMITRPDGTEVSHFKRTKRFDRQSCILNIHTEASYFARI